VVCYSVVSYFLPVSDRLTELSIAAIMEKVFITSIGPYWFFHLMIVCGIFYYACFQLLSRNLNTVSILAIYAFLLILVATVTPLLSIKAAAYYFFGNVLRRSGVQFNSFFRASVFSLLPLVALLCHNDFREWGSIAIMVSVYCVISFLLWLHKFACREKTMYNQMLFIGANTLPIFLFHPIFTMLAKYYQPLFAFDHTAILHTLITIIIAVAGSILIARIMDWSHLTYIFGKSKMIREIRSN